MKCYAPGPIHLVDTDLELGCILCQVPHEGWTVMSSPCLRGVLGLKGRPPTAADVLDQCHEGEAWLPHGQLAQPGTLARTSWDAGHSWRLVRRSSSPAVWVPVPGPGLMVS